MAEENKRKDFSLKNQTNKKGKRKYATDFAGKFSDGVKVLLGSNLGEKKPAASISNMQIQKSSPYIRTKQPFPHTQ